MTNILKHRQDFEIELSEQVIKLTCYYLKTWSGFNHLCFPTSMCDDEPNPKDYLARVVYYNNAHENFPYKTVLTEAIYKIVTNQIKDISDLDVDTVRRIR